MSWHTPVWHWLLQAALGGALVLSAGCLAVALCRQPVRRLRLIELTLAGCLLAPWLPRLPGLPHWSAGVLPSPDGEVAAVPAPPPGASPAGDGTLSVTARPADAVGTANNAPAPVVVPPTDVDPPAAAAAPEAARPAPAASAPRWIVAAYAALAAALLLRSLVGLVRLARLHATTRPAPSPVRELLGEVAGPAGTRVNLRASGRVASAVTYTWGRPVILLPDRLCAGEDAAGLRDCLAHEWAHVERHDARAWRLAALAQLLFFYLPQLWWLLRHLRLCQDYLADARAAEQAAGPEEYATYLVALARRRLTGPPAAALGIGGGRSNLYRRIAMLVLNPRPLERRCRRGWTAAVTLAAAALLALVGAVRLDARTPEAKKGEPAKESPKEKPKDEAPKAETLHYTGKVFDKETKRGIAGVTVTVRRSLLGDPEEKEYNPVMQETKHTTDAEGKYSFTIPPEQVAKRYLYIELDVEHPDYAPRKHFGYALSMIRKNEKMGGRPFFENVDMRAGKAITGVLRKPDGSPASGVKVLSYSNAAKQDGFEYGSFAETRTDAEGRFRLVVITPGPAVFWILPDDFCPSTHALKDGKRGDLGTFALRDGARLHGRVLDAEGKPMAGVNVNAEARGNEELQSLNLPVADATNRSATTDAKGEFAMGPLPPGEYGVKPDEHVRDGSKDDRKRHPLPAVFVAKNVTLKEGAAPPRLELRASPHVVVEAQYIDAKGKKTRGHEFHVFGQMDKTPWFGQGKADPDGKITAYLPHGLQNVQLNLMTNEHGVLRWRKNAADTLHNSRRVDLGTVNEDVRGIELVRYEAPILIVKVTSKDGTLLKKARVGATYPKGKAQYEGKLIRANGVESDVSFEEQEDGRFRSSQLLPDEEVTVTAEAEGYAPRTEKIRLPEKAQAELVLVLEKK